MTARACHEACGHDERSGQLSRKLSRERLKWEVNVVAAPLYHQLVQGQAGPRKKGGQWEGRFIFRRGAREHPAGEGPEQLMNRTQGPVRPGCGQISRVRMGLCLLIHQGAVPANGIMRQLRPGWL